MNRFAIALKEARQKMGLKQEDVARLVGRTKNVVSNWERGDNKPDIDTIEVLCNELGMNISEIISTPNIAIFQQGKTLTYDDLPEDGQKELESYLQYLRQKYSNKD